MVLYHVHEKSGYGCPTASRFGTLKGNPIQQFPQVGGKVYPGGLEWAFLWLGCDRLLCHEHQSTACQLCIDESRYRLCRVFPSIGNCQLTILFWPMIIERYRGPDAT